MKYVMLLIAATLLSCNTSEEKKEFKASSPNGTIEVNFNVTEEGQPYYLVMTNKQVILDDNQEYSYNL